MAMKIAPPTYRELLAQVTAALGPERKPILIGIDGRDGEGKTTASSPRADSLRLIRSMT